MTGAVWTVDQETHNTVTVEFYDREMHRDFHFTDPYMYDKACLSEFILILSVICGSMLLMVMNVDENGTLFSNNPRDGTPATIFYRPHETWTTRADWRSQLPAGEFVRGE